MKTNEQKKAQHTPGPWVYSSDVESVFVADDHKHCPQICTLPAFSPDNTANAYLIAAAPELLETLQFAMLERACNAGDAILSGDEWREFAIKARAAIAKATGEGKQ